jgi:hypothetical protein
MVSDTNYSGHWHAWRGVAWRSLNGAWWIEYRGAKVHVDGLKDLPGWSADLHGQPVIIRGVLEKTDQFVVRRASWQPSTRGN